MWSRAAAASASPAPTACTPARRAGSRSTCSTARATWSARRPGPPTSGTASWHHVAGTFDGGRLRLYVDGHPVGDPSAAVLQIDYAATSSSAAFGRYVGSCDLPYVGDLRLRAAVGRLADARRARRRRAAGARSRRAVTIEPLPPLPAAAPPSTVDVTPPAGPPVRRARRAAARLRARALPSTRPAAPPHRRQRPRDAPGDTGSRRAGRGTSGGSREADRCGATPARTGGCACRSARAAPGHVQVHAAVTPSCSPGVIRARKRG